jgi:hypothetical protein
MSRRLTEVEEEYGKDRQELVDACKALFIALDKVRPQYSILSDDQVERIFAFLDGGASAPTPESPVVHRKVVFSVAETAAPAPAPAPVVKKKVPKPEVFAEKPAPAAEPAAAPTQPAVKKRVTKADAAVEPRVEAAEVAAAEKSSEPLPGNVSTQTGLVRKKKTHMSIGLVSVSPDMALLEEIVAADSGLELQVIRLGWQEEHSWPEVIARANLASLHAVLIVVRLLGSAVAELLRSRFGYKGPIIALERFTADDITSCVTTLRSEVEAARARSGTE